MSFTVWKTADGREILHFQCMRKSTATFDCYMIYLNSIYKKRLIIFCILFYTGGVILFTDNLIHHNYNKSSLQHIIAILIHIYVIGFRCTQKKFAKNLSNVHRTGCKEVHTRLDKRYKANNTNPAYHFYERLASYTSLWCRKSRFQLKVNALILEMVFHWDSS